MSHHQRRWALGGVSAVLAFGVQVGLAGPVKGPASLARCVPPDTRLFLELRDTQALLTVPGGSRLTRMLAGLIRGQVSPASRPAGSQQADTQPAPALRPGLQRRRPSGADGKGAVHFPPVFFRSYAAQMASYCSSVMGIMQPWRAPAGTVTSLQ